MATINRRPSGKWQATVRHEGRSRSRTFTLRVDAMKWARETERQAERGALHATGAQSKTMTFGDLMTRYRDEVTPAKKCARKEWHAVNAFLQSKLARVRIDRLTTAQVAAHRDKRLQSGRAPATVVRELGWLQHAIDIAIRDWGIPLRENVVKRVHRPRIDNRRERRLRDDEWERLIRAAHDCGNALMAPLLVLALETGMRRGELLSMRWRDFDPERRTVALSRTKNGHPRTVPLTPMAVATLSALPQTNERCVPMSGNAVLLAFTRLRRRAGVDDMTFHDLRHEAVSRFVERGLSLAEVQMISGHRDLRMLMRYTHLAVGDIVAKLHSVT